MVARFEPLGDATRVDTMRAATRAQLVVFWLMAGAWLAAMAAFVLVAPHDVAGSPSPLALAAVVVYTFGALAAIGLRSIRTSSMRRPVPLAPAPGLRVAMCITTVPSTEPLEVLEATLRAALAVRYPHDTYVLDEDDDARVRDLCRALGAIHTSRRGRPEHQQATGPFRARQKAGNINAWIDVHGRGRYDVVTFLDSDHAPEPHYLERVLGYFRDPAIGWVQGPQIYRNQRDSFVARGAAELTYSYYGPYLMAMYGLGVGIIDGCHTTLRLATFERIGGFYPVHTGEDLLLTYTLARAHIPGVYVPEVLARGLAPTTWPAFLGQQRRWAFSGVNVKWHHTRALVPAVGWRRRPFFLLHGLAYFRAGFVPLGLALMCALLVGVGGGMPPVSGTLIAIAAGAMALGVSLDLWLQRFNVRPDCERGLFLRAMLLRFARWPTLVAAFVDGVRGRDRGFTLTAKGGVSAPPAARGPRATRPSRLAPFRVHLAVGAVIAACLVASVLSGRSGQELLWLAASLYLVDLAVLVALVLGRAPEPSIAESVAAAPSP